MVTRGSSLRALSRRSTVFSVLFVGFFVALGVLAAGCSLDDGPVLVVAPSSSDGGPTVIEGGPVVADGGIDSGRDGAAPDSGPAEVTVQVVGATTPLTVQEKRDFAALVTGASDTAVTWSVDALDGGAADAGDGGSTSSTGNVTAGGTYTAPPTPGTYTVVATSHADPGASGTATFAVVAAPVATITAPALASANATGLAASVVAQSGATFVWTVTGGTITAGDGTNAVTFTAGASGAVTLGVVVTNEAGTTASGSTQVSIVSSPVVSISVPASVTAGKAGIVASVPSQTGATYAWTITGGAITSATNSTSITFTAGAAGTLTVGCTVTVGAASTPGSADVTVVAAPVAVITAPATAASGATGLTASVAAQTGATFTWSISGGTITAGDGTRAITFSAPSAGTLVLTVTVTNAAGDSVSASANVAVADPPSTPTIMAPASATTGASGLVATITPQSGASYAWSISGGTITTAQDSPTIVFTAGAVGTLTLGVTVTNAAGTAIGSANVAVVAAPVVAITAPASAIAGTSGLVASVPDQAGASYAWTISGGTISGSTTSKSVAFTAGAAGTLVLGCTVTNSAGTSTTGSANVSVVAAATLDVTLVGAPATATVSVSGPDGYAQTVTTTQTLGGLAAGAYAISAGAVVADGFTYTPAVAGSPTTLAAGDSGSVTVTYTKTNTDPTIAPIADQTLAAGGADVVVPFTVGDAEDAASALVVSASLTGTAVTTESLGGSGASRSITLSPGPAGAAGDVTLTVTDLHGGSTSLTFHVTVQ